MTQGISLLGDIPMKLRILAVAVVALGGLSFALHQAKAGSSLLQCELVPPLLDQLQSSHIEYKKPSKVIDDRTVELFLETLDPGRSLLLASEAAQVEERIRAAIKSVRKGECTELDALHADRKAWMKAMETFVEKTVSKKGFEVDRTVELALDPDDRARPTTPAEREELWRKLVHVQIAGYLARAMEPDEAKERLIHRYELQSKRAAEIDQPELYGQFLDAVARSLDPHSTYFSADQLEDFRIAMELSLDGIGAVLTSDDGYTVVREIVGGGAADRNGLLQPDDKIVAVTQGGSDDSVDVIDMDLKDVVKLIRGPKGTPVTLSVLRDAGTVEAHEITIVRDAINLEDQAAALRVETREVGGRSLKLGVLELPGFYGGTGANARNSDEDVARLLAEAKAKSLDGLVLDLSDNGGGLLDHAVTISGYFIGTGPVVGVAGGREKQTHSDKDPSVQWDGPLVVLTSRASASASEIVAGAIKDHARGVLVGDPSTFGKGSVQSMQGLPPGLGALKVTTALFFSPNGQSNQNTGVPVDVVVPSRYDQPFVGEATLPYPLPAKKIEPMTGGTPNPKGAGHWTPISREVVASLATRSAERVQASEPFKELATMLDEARNRTATVKVAELLDGDADEEADIESEVGAEGLLRGDDDDELSLQAEEAINVLADLVDRQRLEG
jgi:carboxyl-terminal processing protease